MLVASEVAASPGVDTVPTVEFDMPSVVIVAPEDGTVLNLRLFTVGEGEQVVSAVRLDEEEEPENAAEEAVAAELAERRAGEGEAESGGA